MSLPKLLLASLAILTLTTSLALAQSATLLPPGEQTFINSNGAPLAGGQACFYIPNTLSPKSTWSDPNQVNLNPSPCVGLDSAGRAILYGNGQYRQRVLDLNGNLVWDQLTNGLVPTTVSPAMAPVVGANTTTAAAAAMGVPTLAGPNNFSGANNETYAALTSASTLNIGAAAANYLQINGTATINLFDTIQAGTERTLLFNGVMTLVNSPALILAGGANITTAVNDQAIFRSLGGGQWILISYLHASAPANVGAFASANITVDQFGRVTAAANGAFTGKFTSSARRSSAGRSDGSEPRRILH